MVATKLKVIDIVMHICEIWTRVFGFCKTLTFFKTNILVIVRDNKHQVNSPRSKKSNVSVKHVNVNYYDIQTNKLLKMFKPIKLCFACSKFQACYSVAVVCCKHKCFSFVVLYINLLVFWFIAVLDFNMSGLFVTYYMVWIRTLLTVVRYRC